MPEIQPFRAWRYNLARIRDLSKVLAPPYDVISAEEQKRLYTRSPVNIVRVELGVKRSSDHAAENAYTRARGFLEAWKRDGTLIRDGQPAVYVYVQEYPEGRRTMRRVGFFASMKIDERVVKKHEKTLAGPKKDRLKLLKEVRTNTSPLFGLFEDPRGRVQSLLQRAAVGRPALDTTMDGVRHRLFVEDDPRVVRQLCRLMRSKPVYIADGHHRFEVAIQFRQWARSHQTVDRAESGCVMVYLADYRHNPFTIFPTHRLLRLPRLRQGFRRLGARGTLRRVAGLRDILRRLSRPRTQAPVKGYTFGVFMRKEGFFIFELNGAYARFRPGDEIARLDVSMLHDRVLGPCFGLRSADKACIGFTRSAEEACRQVREGAYDAAFFLRPTSLDEMIRVSKKGLRMPQKSTYFYPKLPTGLVLRSL